MRRRILIALFAAAAAPHMAGAQDEVDAGRITLGTWSYEGLYTPEVWSVEDFFGAAVHGRDGARIGDVEDLVLNDDSEIVALVAEVGGFWDIGDTHVSVPWDEVRITDTGQVEVPVAEDTVADFDLFASSGLPGTPLSDAVVQDVDGAELRPGIWRASELLGDYARIRDESGETWLNFGYVTDLLIDDGKLAATVVNGAAGYGGTTWAYPYRRPMGAVDRAAWTPGAASYDMPVLVGEATDLPPFERGRIGGGTGADR